MKTTLALLLLTTGLSTQAALVHFDLSPTGTDKAVGLSPSNQVPVAATSSGSGNEISGGIVFDTDTFELTVAIGYGSAAGFTDLTGPATGMHIHGPAGPGTNASVLISLVPLNFSAANPTNGGIIFGTVTIPSNSVPDLLAGLDYINIHTPDFQGGEIRGQLIAVAATNGAPLVTCPAAITVPCSVPAELTLLVSDPEGDALNIVWSVNGAPVQTNAVPASNPPAAVNVTFSASLPFGTDAIGVSVTDAATNVTSCGTTVTVVDTNAPVIVSASADKTTLWPPNHKMILVKLDAEVTDDCTSTTWKIISVSSNEADDAKGSGHSAPDWQLVGNHAVKLRAERSGNASGRIYTITIQATDQAGNVSATETLSVSVPHDQGHGHSKGGNGEGQGDDNNGQGNGQGNGHGNGNGNGKGHGKG
jgi:hypothetical protein